MRSGARLSSGWILQPKVIESLPECDASGLDVDILSPDEGMRVTQHQTEEGLDTVTVSWTMQRDFLIELCSILDLGTGAEAVSSVCM